MKNKKPLLIFAILFYGVVAAASVFASDSIGNIVEQLQARVDVMSMLGE